MARIVDNIAETGLTLGCKNKCLDKVKSISKLALPSY